MPARLPPKATHSRLHRNNAQNSLTNARCSGRTCDLSPRRALSGVKKREAAQTCNFQFLISNSKSQRAISSVVEHLLHTQGVAGSIPASRTLRKTALAGSRPTKELAIRRAEQSRRLFQTSFASRSSGHRFTGAALIGEATPVLDCGCPSGRVVVAHTQIRTPSTRR